MSLCYVHYGTIYNEKKCRNNAQFQEQMTGYKKK